jgi:hypothetical protein
VPLSAPYCPKQYELLTRAKGYLDSRHADATRYMIE